MAKSVKEKTTKKVAKDDSDSMDKIFEDIAAETGGDLLSDIDSVAFFIDTGNLATNYVSSGRFIGGGIPGGRITEVFGPEASGKSLIASNTFKGCQDIGGWSILLDCENASNGEFMEKISHLNLKHVVRYTPPTLEKAFRQIHVATKAIRDREVKLKMARKPILFVFDSLSVPPCERELKENDLPMDFTTADWKKYVGRKEQPGERAKIISAEMRKLQSMVVEQDVTVYIINQTRDKIGVMFGSPETTPGGNAMKFYATLRLRTAGKKKITDKRLDDKMVGINMQVKNIKNRVFRPFAVANDVKLYFDSGVDCLSGLFMCLFTGERIKMKSAGNYYVSEEFLPDGVEEYKFKASKGSNTMPMEVILDNPKLVDGKSREAVEEYIATWNSGLQATESGDFEETEVDFDIDGNPVGE